MGLVKSWLAEQEQKTALAADYLVAKGLLKRCEAHGEIYDGGFWDIEDDFWPKAMADRKRGVNGPIPWAEELGPREFTDLLKEAYEAHNGDECSSCAKIMAE